MKIGRRRVFGGTSGLWISRRRHRQPEGGNNNNAENEIIPSGEDSAIHDDHCKNNSSPRCSTPGQIASSVVHSSAPFSTIRKNTKTDSLHIKRKKPNRVFGVRKRKLVVFEGCDEHETSSDWGPEKRVRISEDAQRDDRAASNFSWHEHGDANFGTDDDEQLSFNSSSSQSDTLPAERPLHPSLQIARDYFDTLDQTSLTLLEDSKGVTPRKGFKLRSRRCKLPQAKAKDEYMKYCDVCSQSNVKALSMSIFLEQRAKYFRREDIFDGMFDE